MTQATAPMPYPLVAVCVAPSVGLGLATTERCWLVETTNPVAAFEALDEELAPRWVWWGKETTSWIAEAGVEIDRCWDVSTVHRLLFGGWQFSIGEGWAVLNGLDPETVPKMGQLDLLGMSVDDGDTSEPIQPDGHLRPEWTSGGWQQADRLATWASLLLDCVDKQEQIIETLPEPDRARSTARSESAAEMLCAEMAHHGLPVNEHAALELIERAAGRRPTSYADEDEIRAERDAAVFVHLNPPQEVNLRNPGEVKRMFQRAGFDLPDTRAWRLEQLAETDALSAAFLAWRKAERIATTYGYTWMDEHISGGRLRGDWSSSDGAAGRMTASAGLHNLPTVMRPIVEAESGFVFVRADLGQIEPRVLAAVSGDEALIEATQGDDLYQPVADRLAVTRDIAKLAVLGAMYGATTGESAHALAGLTKNYPVAMGMLEEAAEDGRSARDIFTSGGRRVRMWVDPSVEGNLDRAITVAASRGRYARNALVQGAAAEFFKVWAITVRRHLRAHDAQIVLCLHDELLVHVPAQSASDVAQLVDDAIGESAFYWSPDGRVRFVADVSIVNRWSEAK